MQLYHFCPNHLKDAILEKGLTLGTFPLWGKNGLSLIHEIQWLTAEPDPKKQSWATRHNIPYSRTEYRLTVDIPKEYERHLRKATDYASKFTVEQQSVVTTWEGSDAWYVYVGRIPPKWIMDCEKVEEKNDQTYENRGKRGNKESADVGGLHNRRG